MRRFLWSAFLILDTLLIVMFAAGMLARLIDPRIFWWPQLYAILLPFVSVAISILGIALAVKKKWLLFSIHLLAILLVAPRFLSFSSLPSPHSNEEDTLRISSYNLGKLESLTQPELAEKVGDVINVVDPDILCLQEFLVRYRGNPLRFRNLPSVAAMFDSLSYQVVASEKHEVSHSFKPVFTNEDKLSMRVKERIALSDDNSHELHIIRTVVRWDGRDAAVYNVHLQTFGERKPWSETALNPLNPGFWSLFLSQYRDAFIDRAWQADKIAELIQKETLPFILVGDFNSTPHNWVYHRIASGLRDAYVEAGHKRKMSYNARFPIARIDHVLLSEQWEVVGADILPFTYSDHRPLLVVIKFKD